MFTHSSIFKIVTALSLTLILGACASSHKEEKRDYVGATKPSRAPSSGLGSASADLKKSTKFSTLSQNIRFSVGSTELSPSNRRALNEIASEMKKSEHSFEKVRISGLTDPTGDSERNQRLSLARAEKVRDYLVSRGVSKDKIEAVGNGAVRSGSTASSSQNARDRRVDFEIVE